MVREYQTISIESNPEPRRQVVLPLGVVPHEEVADQEIGDVGAAGAGPQRLLEVLRRRVVTPKRWAHHHPALAALEALLRFERDLKTKELV